MNAFHTLIRPVVKLSPCPELRALEARGCFGFHRFDECPHCIKTHGGFVAMDCADNGVQLGPIVGSGDTAEQVSTALRRRFPDVEITISNNQLTYRQ